MKKSSSLLLSMLVVPMCLACHSSVVKRKPVKLAGMKFKVVGTPSTPRVEVLDETILFREASRAFRAKAYPEAALKYALIVQKFAEGRYVDVSRFNAGLAYERAGQCDKGLTYFEALVTSQKGQKDAHDALFRMTTCHETQKRWKEANQVLNRILEPE